MCAWKREKSLVASGWFRWISGSGLAARLSDLLPWPELLWMDGINACSPIGVNLISECAPSVQPIKLLTSALLPLTGTYFFHPHFNLNYLPVSFSQRTLISSCSVLYIVCVVCVLAPSAVQILLLTHAPVSPLQILVTAVQCFSLEVRTALLSQILMEQAFSPWGLWV